MNVNKASVETISPGMVIKYRDEHDIVLTYPYELFSSYSLKTSKFNQKDVFENCVVVITTKCLCFILLQFYWLSTFCCFLITWAFTTSCSKFFYSINQNHVRFFWIFWKRVQHCSNREMRTIAFSESGYPEQLLSKIVRLYFQMAAAAFSWSVYLISWNFIFHTMEIPMKIYVFFLLALIQWNLKPKFRLPV